jgi:APA family basic amino acid/polyamine antiporter
MVGGGQSWAPDFGSQIAAFACSCVALLLPSSLLFLLLAVSVPTMLKYMGTCLAAFSVAANHPEVRAQARLKFSPGLVKTLAALGAVAAVIIAALGLSTDVRPYGLLAGWLAVGMAYYAWTRRRRWRPSV